MTSAPTRSADDLRSRRWEPRPTRAYRVFQVVNVVLLCGVGVATLFPFVNIIAQSFSSERYIDAGQVGLLPKGFNLTTYQAVLSNPTFWVNYRNTLVYTVVATAISMVLTTTYAYVLSKKNMRGRRFFIGVAVFTLFFNGGLIPNYLLINNLNMRDTIWALVIPNAISAFNLLVMKSFFETLPAELEEAAQVDGVDTYRILLRIVLPLSKAVLATMTLFYAVSFWNSWFAAFLYLDQPNLNPVTLYLRNLIAGATGATVTGAGGSDLSEVASNIQSVTIILTILPIVMVYPFIQRYFVSGVRLGSVKE